MTQHNAVFRGRQVYTVAEQWTRDTWHQHIFNDRDQYEDFRHSEEGRFKDDIVAIDCARGRCTKVIDHKFDIFDRLMVDVGWAWDQQVPYQFDE